jgi:hypothetical protein
MKFLSRKFLITLAIFVAVVLLKILNRIGDVYFSAIIAGLYIGYVFIQGRIDLEKIRRVKLNENEIEIGDDNEKENEKG